MAPSRSPRRPRPLDPNALEELALRYVGRYATSRSKLRAYLSRKLRERGWNGSAEPDVGALADRFADLGYVDDRSYALAKSHALSARGYGARVVEERLRLAGIGEEERGEAQADAELQAVAAALRFAKRRAIGPFARAAGDPRVREKAIAAMVRAGHSFALARAISGLPPGAEVDEDELREQSGGAPT